MSSWLLVRGDRFEAKAREAGIEPVAGMSLDVKTPPWAWGQRPDPASALVRDDAVDVIHTHHSHDHWLGASAAAGRGSRAHLSQSARGEARWRFRRASTGAPMPLLPVSRADRGSVPDRRHRSRSHLPRRRVVVDLGRFIEACRSGQVRDELGLDGDGAAGPVIGTVAPARPQSRPRAAAFAASAGCRARYRARDSSSSARGGAAAPRGAGARA